MMGASVALDLRMNGFRHICFIHGSRLTVFFLAN